MGDTDSDQLRSETGSGAADIAEIVSDIKTKLPYLDAPPRLDSPEQARFRLFDSITAFLKTASRRKPIMLVRGLTQNDVSRFIEVTSGMAPPATLVSAVHTQTEGKPPFVTEVVRLLVQENLLPAEGVNSLEVRAN